MEEKRCDLEEPKQDLEDSNLPAIMASLEMLTVNNNMQSSSGRRLLRKRIPKVVSTEILNRRCSRKPRKRTCQEMEDNEDVKKYYLDKNIKKTNNLETIFEEKDNINENLIYMSAKRYKRMIQFKQPPTDSKLKKRRAKIKRIFGSKISFKKKAGTMQNLLDKLNRIRSDSSVQTETEVK